MKAKLLIIFLLWLLFCPPIASAQYRETVTIILHSGQRISLYTKLRAFEGKYVFTDDWDYEVKGKVGKKRRRIPKHAISKIMLNDQSRYLVLENAEKPDFDTTIFANHHIGFYLVQGKINVFKTYQFLPDLGVSFIASGLFSNHDFGIVYYPVLEGKLGPPINPKEYLPQLAESCPDFSTYLQNRKWLKNHKEFEKALFYYQKHCQ